MTALSELQEWYLSQCNGDWEHTHGVEIGTLDNPGWSFVVELSGSSLEGQTFAPVAHGEVGGSIEDNQDWYVCEVKDRKFQAYGGPRKLDDMIRVFLRWVDSCRPNTSFERTREG
jgi:hypothetical protein